MRNELYMLICVVGKNGVMLYYGYVGVLNLV